jgi:hypothetical protein
MVLGLAREFGLNEKHVLVTLESVRKRSGLSSLQWTDKYKPVLPVEVRMRSGAGSVADSLLKHPLCKGVWQPGASQGASFVAPAVEGRQAASR